MCAPGVNRRPLRTLRRRLIVDRTTRFPTAGQRGRCARLQSVAVVGCTLTQPVGIDIGSENTRGCRPVARLLWPVTLGRPPDAVLNRPQVDQGIEALDRTTIPRPTRPKQHHARPRRIRHPRVDPPTSPRQGRPEVRTTGSPQTPSSTNRNPT